MAAGTGLFRLSRRLPGLRLGPEAANAFREEFPDLRRLPSADLLVDDHEDSSRRPFSLRRIELRHIIGYSREKLLLVR